MKIVLQHTKTRHYFQDTTQWTSDVEAAFDFGNAQQAIDYVRKHVLADVQVTAAFVNGPYLESIAFAVETPVAAKEPLFQPHSRV